MIIVAYFWPPCFKAPSIDQALQKGLATIKTHVAFNFRARKKTHILRA